MCIIEHYLLQEKLLKVFYNSKQNMMGSAKDVRKERIQRRHFLGHEKYAVEILKRFGMMDCKAMDTPMESNLKLLSDASLESVDATMYHQMIGSVCVKNCH